MYQLLYKSIACVIVAAQYFLNKYKEVKVHHTQKAFWRITITAAIKCKKSLYNKNVQINLGWNNKKYVNR